MHSLSHSWTMPKIWLLYNVKDFHFNVQTQRVLLKINFLLLSLILLIFMVENVHSIVAIEMLEEQAHVQPLFYKQVDRLLKESIHIYI